MRIVEMTARFAAEMAGWRYPEPYQCYDLAGADPAYFTDPANGFHALVDEDGALLGFRSFGADGQVPGGAYDGAALDTGGGLRPELTGRGLGREAIATGLAFSRRLHRPDAFRVTVAAFNTRALHVVESLGFAPTDTFRATADGAEYRILLLR
ncbi:GNAT family N-acetyltransferase [Actinospica durhamensis]|uniref:GNAT family N-acetyltransferase n=1 Tax=Actinospica durhamensis TaxID=1508375 RepID=A0A941IU27_9ACTN|nr:GNAT family protein [Actinospica durhamensis]MBR7836803.1 GNAT family N-acetyltransferase [Actinospica durhamensis]